MKKKLNNKEVSQMIRETEIKLNGKEVIEFEGDVKDVKLKLEGENFNAAIMLYGNDSIVSIKGKKDNRIYEMVRKIYTLYNNVMQDGTSLTMHVEFKGAYNWGSFNVEIYSRITEYEMWWEVDDK